MADGSKSRIFNITIKGSNLAVPCPETEKVLIAIEAAVPFPQPSPVNVGCRKGGCGACRVRVISGEYTTIKMSRAHVTEEEQGEGYALACRIYPQSDMEIETAFISPQERMEMRQTQQYDD